ncbi:FAD-binding protein [Georgenia sp. M64]|uniref:FAD-binding protein n=1 Tax=Georgenia sp. M64 TaxID=3120520 RepID=UPI0030E240DE
MTATPAAPLTNWARTLTFGARAVHRPGSVAELQELVRTSERIRALGTGHSFSRVADTTADLVSVAGLPPTVEIDPARSRVTVAAGVRYGELAERLHRAGLALRAMASLPHISVAGACATGTHGSGVTNQGLASAVSAVELVTGDGELRTLSRADDPEDFPGAVVALGSLGVVVRLTLDVVPTYDVSQVVYEDLPATSLGQDELDEVLAGAYSVSLFTRWRGDDVDQVWLKHRPDDAGTDQPWAPRATTFHGARLAAGPVHPVPGMPAESCTVQGGDPGPWHERLPHFRAAFTPSSGEEIQSEYLVARADAAAALTALRGLRERVAPVLHVSEVRTVAADDLWLSPAYGRDSVALHFTWHKDPGGVAAVLPAVEEALAPYAPRPHWGKVFTIAPDVVRSAYPRIGDFAALADHLDPTGTFRNDFVDTYLPPR